MRDLLRRLDVRWPAFGASLAFHGTLLASLAFYTYEAQVDSRHDFQQVAPLDRTLPELSTTEIQELDPTDKPLVTESPASTAPVLGAAMGNPVLRAPAVAAGPEGSQASGPAIDASIHLKRPTDIQLPAMAANLGKAVLIRGTGAEHVSDAEGAVDRIATEVVRQLERGRTLVVWAFDASGSLQAEREQLSKHIEQVYAHIAQIDHESLARDGGLLTTVVGFGMGRKAMLPEPTADPAAIVAAIRDVPLDTTGIESTFTTVAEAARKWGKFKDEHGKEYHTVVIVVTDEVGNDEDHLEEAIATANAARVPVYVLGSSALFGQTDGYVNYVDPRTKERFYRVPVRMGPESATLEMVHLPFWYEGPQYETLDSGFGPYGLSRLAGYTSGIYFVTRLGPGNISFDPNRMREYRPDWVSRNRYEAEVARHPIRQAVLAAAILTHQNRLPGMPSLIFPPNDGPEFKEAMKANQILVARVEYTVNEALEPISKAVRSRDRETSRRWQAHYDLIRGRLLAVKVRCREYNWACAQMIREQPRFSKPSSNAWRLVASDEIHYSDQAKVAADEAKKLLRKVVEDHPGTPWAVLAGRELKDELGFRWVEITVPPRRRMEESAAKKKAMPRNEETRKPSEPPKL